MRSRILSTLSALLLSTSAFADTSPAGWQGGRLAVLSDGDMVASAYIDGNLGPLSPQGGDALSIVSLVQGSVRRVSIPVSNSVTAWPNSLAISSDGQFAVVAELAERRGSARVLSEVREGRGIRLISLTGDGEPVAKPPIPLRSTAVAAAIRPQDDWVAVALRGDESAHVALLSATGATLGEPVYLALPGRSSPPPDIVWQPSGEVLAATFPDSSEVAFFRLEVFGGKPRLVPVGAAVKSSAGGPGRVLGVGHFSPDGAQLLVTDLRWSIDDKGDYREHGPGEIVSIVVDAAAGRHRVNARAATGFGTEEFAISPDGRWVVGLDMERSYLPAADARRSEHSALTLIRRDPETGALERLGQFGFDGILPEGIVFDRSGRYLTVAVFDQGPGKPSQGRLDFWRLEPGSASEPPLLVKLDNAVSVPRGAHIVKLVR